MNETNAENATQSILTDDEDYDEDYPDYTNYYIPLGVVAVIIVVVNSFIVILVAKNAKLRTSCNALLVSLAIADGTTGLIGIPVLMVGNLHENLPIETMCCLALAIHTWFWFMSVCSILHLLVIACEQYLAILRPFSHDKIVNKTSVTSAIAFIWTISIAHSLVPWTWILQLGSQFCTVEDETVQRNDENFIIASIVLFFFLPLGMISYVYFCIVLEAKCQMRRIKRECSILKVEGSETPPPSSCTRFRGFYVLALMSFVFIGCWTPYFVVVFHVTIRNKELPFWLDYKFMVLRFLPPVLNPLMFAFWKKDFRAACVRMFHCRSNPSEQRGVPAMQQLLNRLSISSKNQSL